MYCDFNVVIFEKCHSLEKSINPKTVSFKPVIHFNASHLLNMLIDSQSGYVQRKIFCENQ